MSVAMMTDDETRRAQDIWREYQAGHDLSQQVGRTAGIDPNSGAVLLADSLEDLHAQMLRAGNVRPLYVVRIGSDYYFRKGGHR